MKHTTMTRLLRRSALVVALLGLLAGTVSAQTYNLVADVFQAAAGECAVGGNYCESNAACTALVCTYGGNSCASDTDCTLTDTCVDTGAGFFCSLGGNSCTSDADCNALDLCDTPDPADLCVHVPMWGFATDPGGSACNTAPYPTWAPGPLLEVDASSSTTLNVNLRNCLTVPVSIVIPGQQTALDPQTTTSGRVRAFTHEVPAGGLDSYTWTGLKAGTYLYHSGSDLATQVHMGLYGALVVDVAAGEAYPGVFYDVDVVLLASEVDPALHDPPTMATPLTYHPKYFLANGVADGSTTLGSGGTGPLVNDRVLFRFVNAGLLSYVPTLLGEDMVFIAEDGNPYNYAAPSYGELLAAGKTLDALWVPVSEGTHALFDRRLHMSSNGVPGGGLVASVVVTYADVPTANAGPDQLHVPMFTLGQPTVAELTGTASGGSLSGYTYQWSLVGFPAGSAATLSDATIANPTFTLDVPGTYTARLVVTDGSGASSAPDSVNIFTNLPPVALASANPTAVEVGEPVQLTGGTSYDPDGDLFGYSWSVTGGSLSPSSMVANPIWNFAAPGTFTATLTVTETAGDLLASEPATVQVTVSAAVNNPPVANTDFYTVQKNSNNNLFVVLANDTDPDGTADINPTTVTIKTPPTQRGTVSVNPVTGEITYSPRNGWRGTDYFTYSVRDLGGLESNAASVVVNVVQ